MKTTKVSAILIVILDNGRSDDWRKNGFRSDKIIIIIIPGARAI